MRQVIFLFFILASFGVRAQDRSYEQMEVDYNRLKNEGKKDSILLVAREMNEWALKNEGDTSLRYAVSFRYVGNGFESKDSSLVYYSKSLQELEAQGRKSHLDYALCLYNLGTLFQDKVDATRALSYYLESYDLFTLLKMDDHAIYRFSLFKIGEAYIALNDFKSAEVWRIRELERCKRLYGAEHSNTEYAVYNLGGLYYYLREYPKAEHYFLQALEIRRKNLGKEHPDYASQVSKLGRFYRTLGEYSRAEPCYLQAQEILRKALGESHPAYASSLNELGNLYLDLGEYAKAEQYYRQALEIRREALGESHPDYASSLNNLAILFEKQCKYGLAESHYLNSLEIYGKTLGEEHAEYARVLDGLGYLYSVKGDYTKADLYYKRALGIRAKTYGENDPEYAQTLGGIGLNYERLGEYSISEIYLIKALEITKTSFGEEHPQSASFLNSLGNLYDKMGYHDKALDYYLKSLEINMSTLGGDHPYCATLMNNIGSLYLSLYEYDKALPFIQRSIEIRGKAFGEEHLDVAQSLSIAGEAAMSMGDYAMADSLCSVALEIKGKILGQQHPDYATGLNNLGSLYLDMGEYAKAEQFYRQALEIRRETLQESHPDYSSSLNSLANLYLEMGEYSKSEKYRQKALEVIKDNLGIEHQDYFETLYNHFLMYLRSNQIIVSDSIALELMSLPQGILKKQSSLNSSLKTNIKNVFITRYQFLLAYAAWRKNVWIEFDLASFNQWMFLNGWLNNRDALLMQEIIVSGNTALMELYDAYHLSLLQLSKHYELNKDELVNRGIDISKEEGEIERMESDLASRMDAFERINGVYDFNDLYGQLKPNEAYVDVQRVSYYDFESRTWPDSSFYMAYVVTADTREAPLLINLGDGKRIEDEVFPFLMGQITESRSATMDGGVYEYLWKPFEAVLEGKKHVYFSPGGIYHNLNLEAIYNAQNKKFLCEERDIHIVSSGRSFVDQRLYGNRSYSNQTALLVGSPDFDSSITAESSEERYSQNITYSTMRALSKDGMYRANALPGTREEVEFIHSSLKAANWNTLLLTGAEANESNLKQVSSSRVLHIATHGFFMEDAEQKEDMSARLLGMDWQRVVDNPLLRSGLLLAGCNQTFRGIDRELSSDNGILTAYEAGLLDLSKTELVVLSACETGKGEIRNGEGVQGLRKAMTDAGAEHILMSLWKVDDKVTSEYMQTFYGHYAQGKSIRESYNLTRNEIKQKYPQPYYWGAFVLVGE